MPQLRTLSLFLPESKITCELGLTYFESLEVQRDALPLKAIDFQHPEALQAEQMDLLIAWQKKVLSLCVKSWNSMSEGKLEPITPETLATLPAADIQLLVTTMMRGVELPSLSTKKKESTPDSFKGKSEALEKTPPENFTMSKSS